MSHSNVNPDLVLTTTTSTSNFDPCAPVVPAAVRATIAPVLFPGDPGYVAPEPAFTTFVDESGASFQIPIVRPTAITAGTVVNTATVALDAAMNLELCNLAKIQNRANMIHGVWAGSYLNNEMQTLAVIANEPKETVNIALQANTALADINQAYAGVASSTLEVMAEMCFTDACGPSNRTRVAKAKSQGWHAQANLRYEEIRVDESNAQRLNNRMAMIAPGRNGAVLSINALVAAGEIFGSIARQAEAAKGGSEYAAGRGIALAQQGLGALSKFLAPPMNTPVDALGANFSGVNTTTLTGVEAASGSYNYDTGAELYGVDPISTLTPAVDIPLDGII